MREIETFKGLDYLAEIKKLNITMTGDYNHICSFSCDEIIFLSSNWILTCRYNISFKGHNLCTSRIWSEIKRLTKTWHVIGCWPPPPPPPPPQQKYPQPQIGNPPVLKLFTLLPSNWKWLLLLFHIWLLPTSTSSHFWSYYNWLNAVIIGF